MTERTHVPRFESMSSSLTKTRSSDVLRMQLCGAGLAATAVAPAHTLQMQLNPPAQEQLQERGGRTAAGSCSGQQPAVGSCSLLHSWRRGEGGYSLARPTAPPLVGNLGNPPSQSLPNVSRFECPGQFFSLVSRESGLQGGEDDFTSLLIHWTFGQASLYCQYYYWVFHPENLAPRFTLLTWKRE